MPTTLEQLSSSQASSSSKIWKWVLGGLITLVAVFIVWKIRSQAKKIARLETDNTDLKCQFDEIALRLKEEKSQERSKELLGEMLEIKTQMEERTKQLEALRDEYLKNKNDIAKVTSWGQIP